jgi:hypothetical protein
MKIIGILFLTTLASLLAVSCSKENMRTAMLNFSTDEAKADARIKAITEAIANRDGKKMEGLFSKKAHTANPNFATDSEELFAFIKGNITSWEKSSGPTVFESNDYGKKVKEITSFYHVHTDAGTYFFLIKDYPVDDFDLDNAGVYMLLAVRDENDEEIYDESRKIVYDGKKKLSHAGIYIPIK